MAEWFVLTDGCTKQAHYAYGHLSCEITSLCPEDEELSLLDLQVLVMWITSLHTNVTQNYNLNVSIQIQYLTMLFYMTALVVKQMNDGLLSKGRIVAEKQNIFGAIDQFSSMVVHSLM